MKRAAAILVLVMLAAGCGEGAVEEIEVSTTAPAPSTTATTVPASSTTQPAPTTTTSTTEAPLWAAPGFPESQPPEEIPWDEVGPDWLLVRYAQSAGSWEESTGEGLFLIDPANATYAVGAWDGGEILDWSPDGSRVLVFDGELKAIDLRDGAASVIPVDLVGEGDFRLDARFLPAGDGLAVRVLDWEQHVRLQRLGIDGTVQATLADLDLAQDAYGTAEFVEMGVTWLFAPGGDEAVVATTEGISLLDGSGALIRPLDTPGLGCTLSRWWDGERALAACYDPDWAASVCWYRGPMPDGRSLWAVPIDGSPATLLTPQPVCSSAATEPAPAYADGLAVGEIVAARTGHCCECGGRLDFIAGDTVTPWAGHPDSYPCSPTLVAARPGGVLVLDTFYGWDAQQGATGMLGVVFAVAPDGTTQAITPAEPGLFGGVQQALTTEETSS